LSILIKCSEKGEMSFNDENLLKEPKIFINDKKQIRTQFTFIYNNKNLPLDIVIYEYTFEKPSLIDVLKKKICASLYLNGIELKSNISFEATIEFEMKGNISNYVVKGKIQDKELNKTFNSINEIIKEFCLIFNI